MRFALFAVALVGCAFEHGALPTDAAIATVDTAIDAPAVKPTPLDCLDALRLGIATSDGPVTIDPDGETGDAPFTAYCDMTTESGGWTLVYVYGFTDFASFDGGQNAATPRPSWPLTTTETSLVPVSTQVPQSPTTPGAVDFARWTELGSEILVTSNINHWLHCQPNGGNLVAATSGDVKCAIVKTVATACTTEVPTYLSWFNRGPTLLLTSTGSPHYYYWEASTASSWPTHDPCGTNAQNHVTAVASPSGAIWLRR